MKNPNDHHRPDAELGGIFCVILSILFFTSPSFVRAEHVLEHYDVDSLCALAMLIVKAETGLPTKVKTLDGECAVWDVKVISCLRGDVKPGTEISVVGIEEYRKGSEVADDEKRVRELSGREVVYLFLVPKDAPGGYAKYRSTDADWKVVPSGVRLVSEEQVYSFIQFWPSGSDSSLGYVVMTEEVISREQDSKADAAVRLKPLGNEGFAGDVPVLATEVFEKKVKTSLDYMADLRRRHSKGRLDAEQRKTILGSRADVLKREWAQDDHIPELLGE